MLAETGIAREKIGILVNTSVCRDFLEPSTASIVAGKLRLPENCQNFDVGNACLAFLNGMDIVDRIAAAGVSPADGMSPMAPISILSMTVKAKG